MFDVAIRDALEHQKVWTGAFLVTAVTAMFTASCSYAVFLGITGPESAFLTAEARSSLQEASSNLIIFSGIPAILVLGWVLNTLVTQTRHTHSMWRLAGASPQQVVKIFSTQVILVSALGALAGAVASIPFHSSAVSLLGRGTIDASQAPPEFASYLAILLSVVVVALWGIFAGIRPALRASRTSPLASQTPDTEPPVQSRRFTKLLLFIALVQAPLLTPLTAAPTTLNVAEVFVALLPASLALVITVALWAPRYLASFIQAWTWLSCLTPWTPWAIARHIAITRANQSSATVMSLMIGMGLFINFNLAATAASNAFGARVNTFDGFLMLTPIATIGAVGSTAVIYMASRHRAHDLTSLRVTGASPFASIAVFICEAVIYIVTAVLLALLQAGLTLLLLQACAWRWQASLNLSGFDWTGPVAVAVLGGVATVSIMLFGGLTAWRRPLATYLANG